MSEEAQVYHFILWLKPDGVSFEQCKSVFGLLTSTFFSQMCETAASKINI